MGRFIDRTPCPTYKEEALDRQLSGGTSYSKMESAFDACHVMHLSSLCKCG